MVLSWLYWCSAMANVPRREKKKRYTKLDPQAKVPFINFHTLTIDPCHCLISLGVLNISTGQSTASWCSILRPILAKKDSWLNLNWICVHQVVCRELCMIVLERSTNNKVENNPNGALFDQWLSPSVPVTPTDAKERPVPFPSVNWSTTVDPKVQSRAQFNSLSSPDAGRLLLPRCPGRKSRKKRKNEKTMKVTRASVAPNWPSPPNCCDDGQQYCCGWQQDDPPYCLCVATATSSSAAGERGSHISLDKAGTLNWSPVRDGRLLSSRRATTTHTASTCALPALLFHGRDPLHFFFFIIIFFFTLRMARRSRRRHDPRAGPGWWLTDRPLRSITAQNGFHFFVPSRRNARV